MLATLTTKIMSAAAPAYTQKQLKQAIEWFVKLQAETCPPEQRQRFQQWLAKHPAHPAAYAQAQGIWSGLDTLKGLDLPALKIARSAKVNAWRNKAASAALCLLLGGILSTGYLQYNAETVYYTTQLGERRTIELADHSQITLNTNTRISVKISLFQRQVTLTQGEAMFTVQHERLCPFSVQANTLQIRDIGTRFNVKLHPERINVAVLEGEVELDDGRSVRHQPLTAGKQVVYTFNHGLKQTQALETEQVTAWQQGHLVFKRTPLREVVAELERYHPVQFVLADTKLANETLSGTFDSDDLEPFLHALETILPVHAKRKGQQIMLRRAG